MNVELQRSDLCRLTRFALIATPGLSARPAGCVFQEPDHLRRFDQAKAAFITRSQSMAEIGELKLTAGGIKKNTGR